MSKRPLVWQYFIGWSLAVCALNPPILAAASAELKIQLGHSEKVLSSTFSPDGRWVFTGSGDGTAVLWEALSGREIRRFEGHTSSIAHVAFSPDGHSVLTGSWDKTARLWDVATGREIRRFEGHSEAVIPVAFSPDGSFVLTGSEDVTARLWSVATGIEIRRFQGHSRSVLSAAFSPDGRSVLTGSRDKTARLWEVATGRQIRTFEGHSGYITSVAFSPDGGSVLTGSWGVPERSSNGIGLSFGDNTARLWDITTGREIRRFECSSCKVTSVAFSFDGRFILTGNEDHAARLWDVTTGRMIRRLECPDDGVDSVAFSPDGRSMLTETALWDIATGRELRRFEGRANTVYSVAFSPDGRFVLTSSAEAARLWSVATGSEIRRFEVQPDFIRYAAFSPDGRSVLTGGYDTARLWDIAAGREVRRFEGLPAHSAAFSSDGRLVLTISQDNALRLWDVATGREIRRIEGPPSTQSAALSPDGRFIITGNERFGPGGDDPIAQLWDTATGREIRRFRGHAFSIYSVAFSPDGRFVLTASEDRTLRLWDIATGGEIRRFEGYSGLVNSMHFSSDGRFLLTGGKDAAARLWDAATGRELRRFESQLHSVVDFSSNSRFLFTGSVMDAAFSFDGRYILTGIADGTTQIWDAGTGRVMATLISFRGGGWAVEDPDGRYDASDPDNAPGLHFVADNDVIELDQLKQRFYSPGLLARIWRGEQFPEIAGSLKDIKLVPGVEVEAPPPGSVEANVRMTNRSGGIGRAIVKVNGRELPTAMRGEAPDPNAKSVVLRLNLEAATLSPTGKNVIEVFAENGDGVIRSRGVSVAWNREPPTQTPPPKLFAIVVGVSSYDNTGLNLRYSAKDAVDFGHALELAGFGLFGKDRTSVTVLASGGALEPMKESIRQAFERVAREAQGSDLLVVYLAGHGVAARNEQDQYYYLTKEARSTDIDRDPGLRAISAVSSAELKEWLSRTNMPLKQVVILDTCAAGAALGDLVELAKQRDLSPDQIRAIELLKDSTGSWILMGSAADAVSYEANRYAQGLLTYALLQGMKGAALEEERVEVGKLFGFAQRQVVDLAKGIGGIQRPVISAPKGQTFPIGMLKEEDRKQIHLATLKPQLLRARVLDDNDLDSLKLEPALRAELRAESLPTTRGSDRREPQIVYLDSVVDEVPDALIPQIRYTVTADRIKIRWRLLRNGKSVTEQSVELPMGDAADLSKALLPTIVSESGRLK